MPWRKGQRWIAQVREGDRRVQKVFATKKDAQDWESEQRQIPANEWKTHTGSSLGVMASEYLKYSETKHSKKTFEEKKSLFKRLFLFIDPDLPVHKLAGDNIRLYLQAQAGNRSGYSANKDRKNILAFERWIYRYKGIQNPFASITEKFPEERHARYVPPEEDFWKVYEVAQGQDKTMLLAYLHLAARRSELFRMTWDDVDFGAQTVRLTTRKRKDGSWEQDYLPMTKDLLNAISAHRTFVGGDLVFPRPGGKPYQYRIHVMKKLCKKAGVRPFGFHAIRHLTATILAQSDVPMIQISQILRHRNLGTTERYLQRLGNLRSSLEKAFNKKREDI